MTPMDLNDILQKIIVLLKRHLKIKAGKDELCCASAEQLFGCFENEAVFQGLGQVQVCISCPFILMKAFGHFSLAQYEVMFTLSYSKEFPSSSHLPPPVLSLPFFLPPFIINCLHLEASDGLITIYVFKIDIYQG